jgi:hypothetical protein
VTDFGEGRVASSPSATVEDRSYLRSPAGDSADPGPSGVPAQKADTVRARTPSVAGMLSILLDTVEEHAGEVPAWEALLRRLVDRDRELLAAAAVYRMRSEPAPDGGDLEARLRSAWSAATLDDEVSRSLRFWQWMLEHQGASR